MSLLFLVKVGLWVSINLGGVTLHCRTRAAYVLGCSARPRILCAYLHGIEAKCSPMNVFALSSIN